MRCRLRPTSAALLRLAVSRVVADQMRGVVRGGIAGIPRTPVLSRAPGIRSAPGTGALRATGAARGDIAAIRASMAGCLEAATDRRSENRYAERRSVGWGCGARARRIRLSEGAMRARTAID